MAEALLTLDGVKTHIGPYYILQGVDLVVPRGGLTMLLGRNGAGKTTTLRTIMGLSQASSGHVTFDGQPIVRVATGRPDCDISLTEFLIGLLAGSVGPKGRIG